MFVYLLRNVPFHRERVATAVTPWRRRPLRVIVVCPLKIYLSPSNKLLYFKQNLRWNLTGIMFI